jgi:tau tubulin kinase
MELLGKNVANFKKTKQNYNFITSYMILIQMLNAIEALHDRGYIHRDIKPTNFVMGRPNTQDMESEVKVYMVDFGLAKAHLDKNYKPHPPRANTDFRGTLTYASLNAHYKKVLFIYYLGIEQKR